MRYLPLLYRIFKSFSIRQYAHRYISECNCRDWREVVSGTIYYELFITNSIGGGTESFAKKYLDTAGHILVLRNISYGKDWAFVLEDRKNARYCAVAMNDIQDILNTKNIEKITVNTLVTNLHTFEFMEMLQKADRPITVMVHDYYLICPKYTLFKGGAHCDFAFCGKDTCVKGCNPFLIPVRPLEEWRERWSSFLVSAKEIRCFSQSSKNIVQYAYPNVDGERITVVPHSMEYCHFTPVAYQKEPFHLGIVGAITSAPKGLRVVRRFLAYAKKRGIMVSVIGTHPRFFRIKGRTIRYTETYRAPDLRENIEKEKVNCLLFPSLCSETFSYLVSEHIMMDLPIVCFDYGAQAEKIRAYKKGIVCGSTEPECIYEALKAAIGIA